jgi:serine/threonine protein kinase
MPDLTTLRPACCPNRSFFTGPKQIRHAKWALLPRDLIPLETRVSSLSINFDNKHAATHNRWGRASRREIPRVSPVDTKPGLQTVGEYDLVSKIADGGMGTVYKGRHRSSGEIVAIKIVPLHLLTNHVFLKRFEQEYQATKAIDHPNIVKAIDFGREGSSPYLVMEYVEGESLGQRLERVHHLEEKEAIQIISQVAQGLHKAHKAGLIHRDVKPDNILLTPEGQVKLTDFGLIKEVETDLNLTRTGRGLGTPHFMAPEQFRNAKKADIRCDIYSLAATLYQMVTGELPFKSLSPLDAWMKKIHNEIAPPRELMGSISERVDWAIRRSMSSDPEQRAATCREFVEDLTGQSTRRLSSPDNSGPADVDLWYMVYRDEDSVIHTVKGSTDGIRRSYKEGYLGDATNIRVARVKQGPFDPLKSRPEFRDLVIDPTPPPRQGLPTPATFPQITVEDDTPPVPVPHTPPAPLVPAKPNDPPFLVPALPAAMPSGVSWSPHIELERTARTPEWIKWTIVMIIAAAVGVASFLLTPVVYQLRLFW